MQLKAQSPAVPHAFSAPHTNPAQQRVPQGVDVAAVYNAATPPHMLVPAGWLVEMVGMWGGWGGIVCGMQSVVGGGWLWRGVVCVC